ncbi:leucyl aminopeptidase [Cytidiella melzeri]|nr:leucyl aminopeptidase [Cytidiella melzeri]
MSGGPLDDYRLPTDVKPTHYDLTLRTDLEKLKFDGYVVIHLDVLKETSKLVFNCVKLALGEAKISSATLKEDLVFPSSAFKVEEKLERVSLDLPSSLPAGSQLQLKIDFEGELTASMVGYFCQVWEDQGKTKHYTLTQFQASMPTDARRAFPCWDEPLLKATFGIILVSRAETVNLSNMPATSEEEYTPSLTDSTDVVSWISSKFSELTTGEADKWKITKFQITPLMSTYTVTFANGPFVYLEDSYTSPLSGKVLPLRIYTTSNVIHQCQFALEVKKRALPLYEQLFDVEYPLPKLDTLVAAEVELSMLENWGLITGAANQFLADPNAAGMSNKKQVARTLSHVVALNWTGNITTMEWWNNLYLSKSFGTLVRQNSLFPDWKVQPAFVSNSLHHSFTLDAALTSHPVDVECRDSNSINQIFDNMSYSKGAAVLRMLSAFIGEEIFLKGVSIYVKKHLYANAVTKDLWKAIKEASGVDVSKIMDNWITKVGYPVITVTETKDSITVRQDRFLETGFTPPKENETIWSVPLSLLTVDQNGQVDINHSIVLNERDMTIPLDTSKPFKLNAGTTGFYRVLYTPERLVTIGNEAAIEDSLLSLEDRIGLVYDALALSRAGYMELSSALSLYEAFRDEKEYLILDSIFNSLSTLASTWYEHADILNELNVLRRELSTPLISRLGYEASEGETADIGQLRSAAIAQAAFAGDESVITGLRTRFQKMIDTGDDSYIPSNLTRVTFVTAVKYGGRAEYEQAKAIVEKPKSPSYEAAATAAMTAAQDPVLAEETWTYIMTKVKDQNIQDFFFGFWANAGKRRFLIDKFRENYDVIFKRLEANFTLNHLVLAAHYGLASDKDLEETKEFFDGKDVAKIKRHIQTALSGIQSRSEWVKRSTTDLQQWVTKRRAQTKHSV